MAEQWRFAFKHYSRYQAYAWTAFAAAGALAFGLQAGLGGGGGPGGAGAEARRRGAPNGPDPEA